MTKKPVSRGLAAVIIALLFVAYTAIYIARLNLAAASVPLEAAGKLTTAQYGIVAGLFSVVYALGRFFNGALCDRLHPAITISAGLGLCALGNILFGFSASYGQMLVLWGVNACAQSLIWSSVLRVTVALYPPAKAQTVSSYMLMSVAAGNIGSLIVNARLINAYGWRYAFLVPGAIVLVLAVVAVLLLPRVPVEPMPKKEHKGLIGIFKEKQIRQALIPMTLYGAIKDNVSAFVFQFLAAVYAVNLKDSGLWAALIPTAGLVGRLLYPFVRKALRKREFLLCTYGFLGTAAVTIPLFFRVPMAVSVVCLALIYTATSMVNTTAAVFAVRFASTGDVATVSGLMDLCAYSGCAVGSVLYGYLIPLLGFKAMFAVWLALALISAVLLHPLRKSEGLRF